MPGRNHAGPSMSSDTCQPRDIGYTQGMSIKITEAQFRDDYFTMTAKAMAKKYGCSYGLIRKHVQKLGLQKNKKLEIVKDE